IRTMIPTSLFPSMILRPPISSLFPYTTLFRSKVILRITEYMNKCYPGSFHVEKMAQLSGMSESSFYHHFKKHTSLTPNQFMTKKRMEHACNLLMSSDLKNNEIAEAVGYQDTYYFNRVFKKNRSEEHTSELQSRFDLVCRLLLEKK